MDRLYDDGQLCLGEFNINSALCVWEEPKNLKSHVDGRVITVLPLRIKDVGVFQRKPGDILAASVHPCVHPNRGESVLANQTPSPPQSPTN